MAYPDRFEKPFFLTEEVGSTLLLDGQWTQLKIRKLILKINI